MSVGETSEPALSRTRPAPAPLSRQRSDAPAAARVMAVLAAVVLGAVLPMLMVVANKSAPAALAAAALLANGSALLGGRRRELAARYRALLASPDTAVVAVVVVLFVASFAWTIDAGMTRRGLVEGLPELVFALGTAAAWPLGRRKARCRDGSSSASSGRASSFSSNISPACRFTPWPMPVGRPGT